MCRHLLLVAYMPFLDLHVSARNCSIKTSTPFSGFIAPRRVDVKDDSSWREALSMLLEDGAVVLGGLTNTNDGHKSLRKLAATLPARLFMSANDTSRKEGIRLLSPHAPVNGVHDELRETERRGLYLPGSGLEPHTDGYVYGDDLPDFVFLLCEQPSVLGGENILLDGLALLNALESGNNEEKQLAEWLAATPVDLSEPVETGVMTGRNAVGPIVQWHSTPSGKLRLKLRRQINVGQVQKLSSWKPLMVNGSGDFAAKRCAELANISYLSLWRPLSSMDSGAVSEVDLKLRAFDAVIQRASAEAFAEHSFMLTRGDALVIDNYRVLHGRAPYPPATTRQTSGPDADEGERQFWRVWSWTSAGTGLPPDGARTSNPMNDDVFKRTPQVQPRADL